MFYACFGVTIISLVIATIINFSTVYLLTVDYEQSKYIGMMLVGAFCLLGYYKAVSPILWFHKCSASLSKITLVVFIINFLLNYLLIPVYGIYGACFATIISILFQFTFTLLLVVKITSVHIKDDQFNEKSQLNKLFIIIQPLQYLQALELKRTECFNTLVVLGANKEESIT